MSGSVALLLVDCINAFFDPDGSSYYPESAATVEPISALLARARSKGCLVVHAVERHRPGLEDFEWRKLPAHCLDGADQAVYPPFAPRLGHEVELSKRRFSAFFGTDLAMLLAEQGIETVVIAGTKTNVCVRATACDAFGWGFAPVVVREATSSNRPHLAQSSLEDIERYMGRVVSLDEGLALL